PAAYARIGLGITTVSMLGLAALGLGIGAIQVIRRRQATPMFAGAVACLGLCMLSTLALSGLGAPVETSGRFARVADDGLPAASLEFRSRADVPTGRPAGAWRVAQAGTSVRAVEKEAKGKAVKDERAEGGYAQLHANAMMSTSACVVIPAQHGVT